MCVERVLSSNAPAAGVPASESESQPRRRGFPIWPVLIIGAIVLDTVAFLLVPPFPKGAPGQSISGIGDLISANLELPAPHVVLDLHPAHPADPTAIVTSHPSISAPILTTWIVMAIVLILAI